MFESSICRSHYKPTVNAKDQNLYPPTAANGAQKNSSSSQFPVNGFVKNQKFSKALLAEKLLSARKKYEPSLSIENQAIHTNNQLRIADAVSVFGQRLTLSDPAVSPEDVRLAVEKNIGKILSNANFNSNAYRAAASDEPHGYGKYLLFSDPNCGAPFCFQYFRFEGYQKTVIHDHPCDCTSYVVSGQLRERTYELVDGELKKKRKDDRYFGSLSTIDLSLNQPHSLKNKSLGPAGSVHVYRIDGVETAAAVLNRYDPALRQKKLSMTKNNDSRLETLLIDR